MLTPKRPSLVCALFVCLIFAGVAIASGDDWREVTPAELQMKTPKVEPDADAEALLWEIYVSDEEGSGSLQSVLTHYLRIKIFNQRGVEAFSKIDIQFGKVEGVGINVKIRDIAARTTKLDGSVVELKSSDIFERDVIKGSGVKLKAKSFAMPGIEPGAVIEYRWKEIRGAVTFHQRLQFAMEIPVELVKYYIKPLPGDYTDYGMSGQPFNVKNTPFVKEKNGYYSTTATNIPSYKEEARMPPEYAVRPWLLLYYTKDSKIEPEKFWKDFGRKTYEEHKSLMKVSDSVKQAANEAVGNETDPEKKVEKIFNFVRSKIKNPYDDSLNLSQDELKQIKANKNPSDTLARGQGDWHDIDMLFGAMVQAAGLDSRVANMSKRSDIFFPKWFPDDYFIRTEDIAVKIGETWKFYDPGSRYITFGMLNWPEEGVAVLVSDPKEPVWMTTPLSPAVSSMEKRVGRFKLLEDGTLEGTVKIEWTGHLAAYHKEYNDDDSQQQREDTLKNLVKSNILGSAEISDISIENVTDPDKPFTYVLKVRVPGYASRTGKRLFFEPNVFERSSKPLFQPATRRHDIYFDYPYSERDEVLIELPPGYELESPDAPQDIQDPKGIGVQTIKISVTKDRKTIIYNRNFSFGNGGAIVFPLAAYPALKAMFEAFNQANSHVLTLKQSAATGSITQ